MKPQHGSPLAERIAAEYASAAGALPPASPAAAERRRAALEALASGGLPSARDENWKYANLRPLERQRFIPARVAEAQLPPELVAGLPAHTGGFTRYAFVDGVFAATLSAAPAAGAARIRFAADPAAVPRAPGGDERFALLNEVFASGAADIHIAAGTDQPVRLELLMIARAEAAAGASYPRVALRLDPGARLELIERYVSAGAAASFVVSAVSVELANAARLEHYRLQELNGRSILFDTLSARLAQQAAYRLRAINTGAQAARTTLALHLEGERAQCHLAIAALGDRQQVQDSYAVVEHAAPDTHTTQIFRGISAGRARVACNGKIVVTPRARGTDSRQSLRGLLAGAEAEIDVRPQLEIHTDDVRCSHGATAGKLDEQMLFYLLSRGLTRAAAQRLLKWAFLEDVIAQISQPALRRQIEERLAAQLRDDTLLELL